MHLCHTWQVRCSNRDPRVCYIQAQTYYERYREGGVENGHENARELAIAAWEDRDVYVPVSIRVPNNHVILERVPLASKLSYQQRSRMVIEITPERGIAEHFSNQLKFVFEDDKPNGCRFAILMPMETMSARLISMEKENKWSMVPTKFTFDVTSTNKILGKNKQDEGWKKQPVPRAPFYDTIEKKMFSGAETDKDEDEEDY